MCVEVEEARVASAKQAKVSAAAEVACARAEVAEEEAGRVREELKACQADNAALEEALRKQGEDSEAALVKSGGEREAVMASQVSSSLAKVRALEKQVEEGRVAAAKQAKVSAAVQVASLVVY